ncbi:VWA domain-containing protein [Streptomyces johnsoniae]|uniref:VWA domain-containing protein n=1 Tax=Streptomyces johnsoniae TaxID=3075532 RepID=A0ABU2RXK8_9ACTN|nr:VWA domain-containing protein [Streptomyces sp. DSM 41886]MDT0441477.1 VWA domain-containing protein [Streptomyces sp. DSM 41886]
MTTPDGGPRAELTTAYERDQYAHADDRAVGVLVGVTVSGLAAVAGPPPEHRSEVIVIDCSGSMARPSLHKIAVARRAAAAAVAALPEGVHFALVKGTGTAQVVYPWHEPRGTVPVTARTREEAIRTALGLTAHGGTRIDAWLDTAHDLLATRQDAAFRHALLLTDGRNRPGAEAELSRVLHACAGQFRGDALGIGDLWDAEELTRITGRLNGLAHGVARPGADGGAPPLREQVTELFEGFVHASAARKLRELTICVRPEPWLSFGGFRQLTPVDLDLTARARDRGGDIAIPTGAWADETRWYRLRLHADATDPRFAAARRAAAHVATVGLAADGLALPPALDIAVRWTDEDPPLTNPGGAAEHFARQAEMNEAARRGARAVEEGDTAAAERHFGRAVRIAHENGNEVRLAQLRDLVLIDAPDTGRVRLRPDLSRGDLQTEVARSSHVRNPAPGVAADSAAQSGGLARRCPVCGAPVPPGRFCNACGTAWEGGA